MFFLKYPLQFSLDLESQAVKIRLKKNAKNAKTKDFFIYSPLFRNKYKFFSHQSDLQGYPYHKFVLKHLLG